MKRQSCVENGIAKLLSWLVAIKTPQWEEKYLIHPEASDWQA
jgi:hypothetical protein